MHEIFVATFAVFLLCKIAGIINWNWGWVLAPVWIELIIVIFLAHFGTDEEPELKALARDEDMLCEQGKNEAKGVSDY